MEHIETLEDLERFLGRDLSLYEAGSKIDHPGIRISRALDHVARHIRNGDRTAAEVGYQLILKDPHLPFGKLIKSAIARALKHRIELLSEAESLGLIEKTRQLLSLRFCPRETEDYCKFVRKIGPAAAQNVLANVDAKNDKSRRLLAYLGQPFAD